MNSDYRQSGAPKKVRQVTKSDHTAIDNSSLVYSGLELLE